MGYLARMRPNAIQTAARRANRRARTVSRFATRFFTKTVDPHPSKETEMNAVRRTLSVVIGLTLTGIIISTPAFGAASVVSDVAPPPARAENVAPRAGYIWAPGHWDWNGHSYAWVSGSYVFDRRPATWAPDHWEQSGAQWQYVPGHWEH
jgi:hypothetical protein